MTSFLIPGRFNGPPESGNGGWVSGHLATRLPDAYAVSVRLRTPPPLDRSMRVEAPAPDAVELWHEGVHVASGHSAASLGGEVVPPVSLVVAEASSAAYEGLVDHPFPSCFSCGTARTDGLGLRPGRVPGGNGEYAADWTPTESDVETVWAALDCPGGWSSGMAGRPMVLGTMTARVEALPAVGEPHVVMAWSMGHAGRRHFSGSALYAADGRLLARAEATWIGIDPASIRPAPQ